MSVQLCLRIELAIPRHAIRQPAANAHVLDLSFSITITTIYEIESTIFPTTSMQDEWDRGDKVAIGIGSDTLKIRPSQTTCFRLPVDLPPLSRVASPIPSALHQLPRIFVKRDSSPPATSIPLASRSLTVPLVVEASLAHSEAQRKCLE